MPIQELYLQSQRQLNTKPTILITSLGRTGTEFFAKLFADIIPGCTSLHEPDIVQVVGIENKVEHFIQQTRRAGIRRMLFLKALGQWTLVKLSDARFLGSLNDQLAAKKLHDQRMDFVSKLPGSIYVESNIGYYGLLDVIPNVFANHAAVYVVRDGRNWIRSAMNWGEAYGKKGLRKLISHKWPTASDVPGDHYAKNWDTLSRFEQLCWAWSRLNEYALNTVSKNPQARVFCFEKIFLGEERYQYLNDLVTFATSLPGIDPESIDRTDGWLERKIHMSSNQFPGWEKWTTEQKHQFEQICGPLMEKLGYTLD